MEMNERTIKIGNRLSGLAMIAFGGIIMTSDAMQVPFVIGGTAFMIEGMGDLITGDHHYVSVKVQEYIQRRRKVGRY